jgi:acyl carrier protein
MSEVQTTSHQIRDFILRKFPLARKRGVKESDLLLESGILDSMGVLEVVHFIEEEFRIQISDEELVPENFQSIERLVSFLQSKTKSVG